MEIEKEDLSASLAKPEFKPFQNDGKTGNSSAQEHSSRGQFLFSFVLFLSSSSRDYCKRVKDL